MASLKLFVDFRMSKCNNKLSAGLYVTTQMYYVKLIYNKYFVYKGFFNAITLKRISKYSGIEDISSTSIVVLTFLNVNLNTVNYCIDVIAKLILAIKCKVIIVI